MVTDLVFGTDRPGYAKAAPLPCWIVVILPLLSRKSQMLVAISNRSTIGTGLGGSIPLSGTSFLRVA